MTWDKTLPLGTALANTGDDSIREMKADLEDALSAEGTFPGSDTANPVYIHTPSYGDTAGRPATNLYTGRLYYNTTTETIQRYNGSGWDDILLIKDATVTAAKLAAAVAGDGLVGGAGTALAVDPDGTTLELSAADGTGKVRIKDLGVSEGKLAANAVVEGKIDNNAVAAGKLKTGTGSSSSGQYVQMNDYCFFPSLASWVGNDALTTWTNGSGDPGNDTIGRFGQGNTQLHEIQWRYVTASDNPRIWALLDKDGNVTGTWESEDPPNQLDWDIDGEINPLEGNEGEAVKCEIVPFEDSLRLFNALDEDDKAAALERMKRFVLRKPWRIDPRPAGSIDEILSGIPNQKKPMAHLLAFRAVVGRLHPAHTLKRTFEFSKADKRLVPKKEHVSLIRAMKTKHIRGGI